MQRRSIPSGLKIRELIEGTGRSVTRGDEVSVHFRCFLNQGEEISNTYEENVPYRFSIGKRQAIAGVEHGVTGMRIGGCRELIVSPHLAYGETGTDRIPPHAVLKFVIELLAVESSG